MPGSPYTDLSRPPLRGPACAGRWSSRAGCGPGGRAWPRPAPPTRTRPRPRAAGAPEGLVLVAERQTAGRGRLRPRLDSRRPGRARGERAAAPGAAVPDRMAGGAGAGYGWLPLLAGVALAEAVGRVAEVDAALKWPNDLLVDGAQVRRHPGRGGARYGRVTRRHAGGGARHRAQRQPARRRAAREPHRPPATSLRWPGRRPPTGTRCCGRCCGHSTLVRAWRAAGGDPDESGLRGGVRATLRHAGPAGAGAHAGRRRVGRHRDRVDADGRLVVDDRDGCELRSAAGDVVHVRPRAGPPVGRPAPAG